MRVLKANTKEVGDTIIIDSVVVYNDKIYESNFTTIEEMEIPDDIEKDINNGNSTEIEIPDAIEKYPFIIQSISDIIEKNRDNKIDIINE